MLFGFRMKTALAYERFPMLDAAWIAARSLVDDRGDLRSDLNEAEKRFLKQKSCQSLAEEDCRAVFCTAVGIAQATTRFRRSHCGALPPKPAKRYELLLTLANELESSFPQCDAALIFAGCRQVEMYWDR